MVEPNFPAQYTTLTNYVGPFPLPVEYGDDGYTAVTVKITAAAAGDLTVFTMSGESAVVVPVAVTAGDEAATAADIAAAPETGFAGTSRGDMVSISRENTLGAQYAYPPGFSVVTFDPGTTAVVVNTRLVIQEVGGTSDGTYLLLDAANPFNPGLAPGAQPAAGTVSVRGPVAITQYMYLWIDELGTLHRITEFKAGGYGRGPQYQDVAYHITLDPVPATAAGELYAVRPFLPMRRKCRLENVGGAPATVDGQVLADGFAIDLDARTSPYLIDASGTVLQATFDAV